MKSTLIMVLGAALSAPVFAADVYEVDPVHTTIGFSAKHMVVGTTRGKFDDYKASIEADPADLTTLKATATIVATSINTGNEKRDKHLRSPDFFDVEKYPEIKFESTKVEKSGEDYVLTGNLTMKDVTKEIAIPVSITGPVVDPYGNSRMGFEGSLKINRKDWNINFSATLDNGGLVVSDIVKIEIAFEGIKRK